MNNSVFRKTMTNIKKHKGNLWEMASEESIYYQSLTTIQQNASQKIYWQ